MSYVIYQVAKQFYVKY